ncbi:hypothetical protein HID58_014423 [Brassica napus]|uniref:Uncharacterized protein n=1 Tax=Brassica napus TaxID=3708 RepID=A0ABQ8DH30_BRANA|nr:hypothetical protein HID58_014423 [Brassica napus]
MMIWRERGILLPKKLSFGSLISIVERTLIAIQNLGIFKDLGLEINEVLFSYYLSPLSGGEDMFYLHPRMVTPL